VFRKLAEDDDMLSSRLLNKVSKSKAEAYYPVDVQWLAIYRTW
jgi:hypothetical protein